MPRAEGIVYKVLPKQTKVGTTYQIKIDGDEKYYGTYKTEPGCSSGDFVKFDYTTNAGGWHNVEMSTLTYEAGVQQESAGASEGAKAAVKSNDGRQMSIVWQHSQEMALRLLAIAADADALDLGAGKKAGKFEALQIMANAQTVEYYDDAMKAATGVHPFEDT